MYLYTVFKICGCGYTIIENKPLNGMPVDKVLIVKKRRRLLVNVDDQEGLNYIAAIT